MVSKFHQFASMKIEIRSSVETRKKIQQATHLLSQCSKKLKIQKNEITNLNQKFKAGDTYKLAKTCQKYFKKLRN